MLLRYNTDSISPSRDSSWTRSFGLLNPTKDINDEYYTPDLSSSISLPRTRTNLATVQHQLK